MSKIIINNTNSTINIFDTGISIDALENYTIPPTDYLLWAASDNIITYIGSGDVTISDGSVNLSISDGVDLIKGIFPTEISTNVISTENNPVIVDLPQIHHDGFGTLVTTSFQTIWDGGFRYTLDSDYWNTKVSGGATVTHAANSVSTHLNVGTANNDKAILQTYQDFHYVRGNAQVVRFTGVIGSLKSGVKKRIGLFNDYNGIFFETDGTDIYCVIRSSTTGSVVDTRIGTSSWSIDSSIFTSIDYSKMHLFQIDFAWLGIGMVRWSIFLNNQQYILYTASHSNILTLPWSASPTLPFRASIENTSAQSTSDVLKLTCIAIKSMGDKKSLGIIRMLDTGLTPISLSTSWKVIAGMRLNTASIYGSHVQALNFQLIPYSGSQMVYYRVIQRATLTGASWSTFSPVVDVLSNAPSYSGGFIVTSGYLNLGNSGSLAKTSGTTSVNLMNDKWLGHNIDGVGDSLIIVARTFSSTGEILFNGQWEELN